jgi:alkanesulfonate monooxygenase SsuD/methylene tetrahydromethanopterin reductase-like flavin-dependent oxidoreductase (luciferase family)
MDFGYFTLSDNHYENNTRSSNQFVADITAEALYAEKVGMHSAWIGEHHFNSLGVLSCPDMVLAYVAANTTRLRLAPAVNVLPLHHPIRVAEQWATLDLLSGGRVDFACGRGYDKREYLPFHVSFEDNQVRLAVSPEPKQRSRVATRKEATRAGRQGSKASYWPRRIPNLVPVCSGHREMWC